VARARGDEVGWDGVPDTGGEEVSIRVVGSVRGLAALFLAGGAVDVRVVAREMREWRSGFGWAESWCCAWGVVKDLCGGWCGGCGVFDNGFEGRLPFGAKETLRDGAPVAMSGLWLKVSIRVGLSKVLRFAVGGLLLRLPIVLMGAGL
jgi:hypothetical protein